MKQSPAGSSRGPQHRPARPMSAAANGTRLSSNDRRDFLGSRERVSFSRPRELARSESVPGLTATAESPGTPIVSAQPRTSVGCAARFASQRLGHPGVGVSDFRTGHRNPLGFWKRLLHPPSAGRFPIKQRSFCHWIGRAKPKAPKPKTIEVNKEEHFVWFGILVTSSAT